MKIKNYIFQAVSILMLLCVFTTQVSAIATASHSVSSTTDDDSNDKQANLKQLSQESVVPHYSFSFGEINGFFVTNYISTLIPKKETNASFGVCHPSNSYFEKLFEHHIAINAP